MGDFRFWGAVSFGLAITSIVLAGGRSSRLGREKHAEVIDGESLIKRVITRLSLLSREILVVISQRQARMLSSLYTHPDVRTVVDLYPSKSSLGGIYTGLINSANFFNLVVACDMPFLNLDLLRHMVELSPGYDVVIPRIVDKTEPLHAVYSKNCIDPMEKLLEKDNLKITAFFNTIKVRYVEKDELERFDPGHLSFFNINTEADLEKARRLAAQETAQRDPTCRGHLKD